VSDRVDHAAGLTEIAKIGSYVEKGEPLLVMRSNAPDQLAEAREVLRDAFVLADEAVEPPPLICEKITPP
jgi:thymidine phosphorylase